MSVCLPLYLSALSWTVLYDTIYAHQVRKVVLQLVLLEWEG